MEMLLGKPPPPDVSAEQRTSDELIKLTRKLRWMGTEKEAEGAEMQLALWCVSPTDSVLAAPHDTD